MKATPKQLASALVAATEGKSGKALQGTIEEFVSVLHAHGWLHRWRDIVRAVDPAWRAKYGVANVTIETAHALSKDARASLTDLAKGADVKEVVRPELIGGARLRLDDRLIDGSVAGQLERLRTALNE